MRLPQGLWARDFSGNDRKSLTSLTNLRTHVATSPLWRLDKERLVSLIDCVERCLHRRLAWHLFEHLFWGNFDGNSLTCCFMLPHFETPSLQKCNFCGEMLCGLLVTGAFAALEVSWLPWLWRCGHWTETEGELILAMALAFVSDYQSWNVFKKKLTRLLMLNQLCYNWQESPFLRPFFINILCEFMWAFWDFDLEIVGCNGVFLVWEATFFILRHRTSNVHVFVGVWWISGEAERDFWCCGTCDSREKSCLDLKSSTSEDKQR